MMKAFLKKNGERMYNSFPGRVSLFLHLVFLSPIPVVLPTFESQIKIDTGLLQGY